MKTVTNDEAAKILNIPVVAMGQIIFDNKLHLVGLFQFDEAEVIALIGNEPDYLETLR